VVFGHFYPAEPGAGEEQANMVNGVLEQDAINIIYRYIFRCVSYLGLS
jgi:hypothetical protein